MARSESKKRLQPVKESCTVRLCTRCTCRTRPVSSNGRLVVSACKALARGAESQPCKMLLHLNVQETKLPSH